MNLASTIALAGPYRENSSSTRRIPATTRGRPGRACSAAPARRPSVIRPAPRRAHRRPRRPTEVVLRASERGSFTPSRSRHAARPLTRLNARLARAHCAAASRAVPEPEPPSGRTRRPQQTSAPRSTRRTLPTATPRARHGAPRVPSAGPAPPTASPPATTSPEPIRERNPGAAITSSSSTSAWSRAATIGKTDSAGTGFLT